VASCAWRSTTTPCGASSDRRSACSDQAIVSRPESMTTRPSPPSVW
jgi:hypothetical protein